jgi:hypothetical protein
MGNKIDVKTIISFILIVLILAAETFFGVTITTSLNDANIELKETKSEVIELKQENEELKSLIEKGW